MTQQSLRSEVNALGEQINAVNNNIKNLNAQIVNLNQIIGNMSNQIARQSEVINVLMARTTPKKVVKALSSSKNYLLHTSSNSRSGLANWLKWFYTYS
ncbi:hypothetical protein PGH46_17920 [Legionella pneumophila]|nr:hypothetical protein PGH46_17920 [Legionella pneumophila]